MGFIIRAVKELQPINFEVNLERAVLRARTLESRGRPMFPTDIDAVWAMSGPGTYFDRLKPKEEEWKRHMDRDRIRTAYAIVRLITADMKSWMFERQIRTHQLDERDLRVLAPYLIYNGAPVENQNFKKALAKTIQLPENKVIVIEKVMEGNLQFPIRNTGDQVKSFYQELANPHSRLFAIQNVLIVSHSPHFVRIPHYIKMYEDKFLQKGGRYINFWGYAVKSRPGVFEEFLASELEKFVEYAHLGYLSPDPTEHFAIV